MGSMIDAGAQVQQVLNLECKNPFFESPLLELDFRWALELVSVQATLVRSIPEIMSNLDTHVVLILVAYIVLIDSLCFTPAE